MVKHGALSKSHMYRMLASQDANVRRAAFILLEASNPKLRRRSELFMEVVRFIWDANPSYEVYREFSRRHSCNRYGPRYNSEELPWRPGLQPFRHYPGRDLDRRSGRERARMSLTGSSTISSRASGHDAGDDRNTEN
jgi:hypothetical protein